MQNMWNTFNNNLLVMGQNKNLFPPNSPQKRHYSYEGPNVTAITTGKSFNNPNFVNKNYPKVHSYQIDSSISIPSCQTDNQNSSKFIFGNTLFRNSSPSIVETIKEKKFDVIQPLSKTEVLEEIVKTDCEVQGVQEATQRGMCNKRTRRNKYKDRKGHTHHKNSEKSIKNNITEMMEVDVEPQSHSNHSFDVSMSPKKSYPLTLGDFLHKSLEQEDLEINVDTDDDDDDVDPPLMNITSSSPCNITNRFRRERTISAADSEDSFIVFESGTDDELEFSDNSQEEDESDEENCGDTDEDEEDSSPPVVPRKKVRFADDSELCQIHPMIMWSYAYQKARIGPWQKYAVDRVRFKDHIKKLEEKIKPVLDGKHREQIFKTRFQDSELPQG